MAVIPLPTPSFGILSSNNTPPTLEKFGIIFGIFSGFISALAGVASWWLVTRSGQRAGSEHHESISLELGMAPISGSSLPIQIDPEPVREENTEDEGTHTA